MKLYMVMAFLAPSMSFAFWGPALPFAAHSKQQQQQQQQCGQHLSATTSKLLNVVGIFSTLIALVSRTHVPTTLIFMNRGSPGA
jgi:hypothetical protein